MRVHFAFLADYCDGSQGKIHAMGIGLRRVFAPDFPFVLPMMSMVTQFEVTDGEEIGEQEIRIQIRDTSSEVPITAQTNSVNIPTIGTGINFAMNLGGISFTKPGDYVFEAFLGRRSLCSLPFQVGRAEQISVPKSVASQ
jgi:hypothetical protein